MTDKKSHIAAKAKTHVQNENILKVSKEVAIKFIEMGRITPATFDATFKKIYATVKETVDRE